jgi:hypothetical protein
LTGIKSGTDRPSNAVTYWMPTAVFALVIVFVIAFVLRLPTDRTIVASALAAGTVFSGFFIRSLVKDNYTKSDSI